MPNAENLLSVKVERLNDDEKEDLYNWLIWLDTESDSLETQHIKAAFKIAQQLLREKGEQVETLLQELDDLAIRKGEDEGIEGSSKSWKSNSIEYENLEQKYTELKVKMKKTIQANKAYNSDIEKLKRRIINLEKENGKLLSEIQTKYQDIESETDTSESVKYKQKELASAVHNKNLQITDLLQDIEEVEKENCILRDKLSALNDELSVATNELQSLIEMLKAKDLIIEENAESLNNNATFIETLQSELHRCREEKKKLEHEISTFSSEIESKIDKWKVVIDRKNAEIERLKNIQLQLKSPEKSDSDENIPDTYLEGLQKTIMAKDSQLMDLKSQLNSATQEIVENTALLKQLIQDKEEKALKLKDLNESLGDIKLQLKKSHERCINLQNEVEHAEKVAQLKDTEMKNILQQIKQGGDDDLAERMTTIHSLKMRNILQEKELANLVKASNKLQNTLDELEKENQILREFVSEEELNKIPFTSKHVVKEEKAKREIERLANRLRILEEERLQLKIDLKNIKRENSLLTERLKQFKPNMDDLEKIEMKNEVQKDEIEYERQLKDVRDENELLKNILKEFQADEAESDIKKSPLDGVESTEKSGSPAYSLFHQIDILKTVNKDLEERLQTARTELLAIKSNGMKLRIEESDEACQSKEEEAHSKSIFTPVFSKDFQQVESLKCNILQIIRKLNETEGDIANKIDEEFIKLSHNLEALHENCINEKSKIHDKLLGVDKMLRDNEEQTTISEDLLSPEKKRIVALERKLIYLQKEADALKNCKELISEEAHIAKISSSKTISIFLIDILKLQSKIKILESERMHLTDGEEFTRTNKTLEESLRKYRQLITEVKQQNKRQILEIEILKQSQRDLENEKCELKTKLSAVLHNPNLVISGESSDIHEKFAQSQMNEISERQRADHTNNLYHLVKEQLDKSEDKLKEFSKYGEGLVLKNLTLQEQLKDAENKLLSYVNLKTHKDLQDKYNSLLKEKDDLLKDIVLMKEQVKETDDIAAYKSAWLEQKEQELFNLRHQVVDLASTSDEKILIGQLHADICRYRQEDIQYKQKINFLETEASDWKDKCLDMQKTYEKEKLDFVAEKQDMNNKFKILQDLLFKQKSQYFACLPLSIDEMFIESLNDINRQKHETFLIMQKAKDLENQQSVLKEQYENQLQKILTPGSNDEGKKLHFVETSVSNLENDQYVLKRQCDFKDEKICFLSERIKMQDDQIAKLEKELLLSYKNANLTFINSSPLKRSKLVKEITSQESFQPVSVGPVVKILKNEECQVDLESHSNNSDSQISNLLTEKTNLKSQLVNFELTISTRDQQIIQLNNTISEMEVVKNALEKQILENQNQILLLEKKVRESQCLADRKRNEEGAGDGISVGAVTQGNDDIIGLKTNLRVAQESLALKDIEIVKYQTLLKEDRDKHSLAAANIQQDFQMLQKALLQEKQKCQSIEESCAMSKHKQVVVEKYISQVHSLERHLAELHTNAASLETRLQASQQEVTRWRTLAASRLKAMEELGRSLDNRHNEELSAYREDCELLKQISKETPKIINGQIEQSPGHIDHDILELIREKDDKIRQLTAKLNAMKSNDVKSDTDFDQTLTGKGDELEGLLKERDILKKRCQQLSAREQILKNEIRELKNQVLKKPSLSHKNKEERSIKDQLQKKISTLENEIEDLSQKLQEQIAMNERHNLTVSENFNKWKKAKFWQESCEKSKTKLKQQADDFEKLQQTCTGYRLLIERLEREKVNLENRVRFLKSNSAVINSDQEIDALKAENFRLKKDLEALCNKIELQQHHAGGLGAAMLQEKLEAQERKIAILELSAKGSSDVRGELERLQQALSNSQKSNLCLEAENLQLQMDIEKYRKEIPHLQEQIQYLESYIEFLKKENTKNELQIQESSREEGKAENKTVCQLERTVFILKRVVEKLQIENKKLLLGSRPLQERPGSSNKCSQDYRKLKDQYTESLQKISKLETQLSASNKKLQFLTAGKTQTREFEDLNNELISVREELNRKSQLLDKVKTLLRNAGAKEKMLLEEISVLRRQKEGNGQASCSSPILEESEPSSDI